MSTIGLDSMYFATCTEDDQGLESYGTPQKLAKAISAELSVEIAEAILYADDAAAESIKSFKNGKLTLGMCTPTNTSMRRSSALHISCRIGTLFCRRCRSTTTL